MSKHSIILFLSLFSSLSPLFTFQVVTEISETWMSMELSYEDHYQTAVPLLKCDETLIETLEDHQVNISVPGLELKSVVCEEHW